jgi:hypothetical protein
VGYASVFLFGAAFAMVRVIDSGAGSTTAPMAKFKDIAESRPAALHLQVWYFRI